MPEVEMVEGEEIFREEANSPGWTTAVSVPHEGVKGGRRTAAPQGVAKRLEAASRLPRLPRDHIRIIVRPRDGLDIQKVSQIWLAQALAMAVALAPAETEGDIKRNAQAYTGIQQILLSEGSYTVAAYMAAPDNTCKGVIRGVVVLFDGMKVSNYVMCGVSILRCTLYRRQTDVCYCCGASATDGCPSPSKKDQRDTSVASVPGRGRYVTPAGRQHSLSRRRSFSRWRSRFWGRIQNGPTWAD
ncbi:hypothetical protein HPB48_017836 [Haemaphysalis longicornis]|uniref:Uncharacterized protein n=1 Tax=Haemaphysalis longicornis TaxID=44386 RepID=A0A9J6FQF7_HAELO|nr:hypothetical protein HPB48_017836 [Haemaphysalis longicornis]